MQIKSIAQACTEARDLIMKDGFVVGDNGWEGRGGWCIEGALAHVLGIERLPHRNAVLSHQVNLSEVGRAIHNYLVSRGLVYVNRPLHSWNDANTSTEVLRVLAEVAALHPDKPKVTVTWDRILNAVSFAPTPVWMTVTEPEPEPEPEDAPSEETEAVLVGV